MPPRKPEQFNTPKKSKEAQAPETEIDFLEVADELEASGGKWKAGDSARAVRFYQKALQAYDAGLQRFPKSFDLAYNKALLLYSLSQDRRLSSHVGRLVDILEQALDAHRYALKIDAENADVLFNTAQVLTSLAEELHDENDDGDAKMKAHCVELLQGAVEMFNACLARQEMEYEEMRKIAGEFEDDGSEDGGVPLVPETDEMSRSSDTPEEWATVKEPITPSTLIETALAQLGALSSLATVAAPTTGSMLANLQEIATPLIKQKLPAYIQLLPTVVPTDPNEARAAGTPFLSVSASTSSFHATAVVTESNPQVAARAEADLAIAVFSVAIAAAQFQSQLLELEQYLSSVNGTFANLASSAKEGAYPASSQVPILSAYADALIEFAENVDEIAPENDEKALSTRWSALESAQTQLTNAISLLKSGTTSATEGPPTQAQIYFTRANTSLLQRQLTLSPIASPALKKNAPVLLKNAGVWYRGAAALAKQDGDVELEKDSAARNGVVKAVEEGLVKEDGEALREWAAREGGEEGVACVVEMIEEGLLGGG